VPRVAKLLGLPPSEAFAALREVGLQPVLIGVPRAKFNTDTGYRVAGQEPSSGREVDPGTRVALALEYRRLGFGSMLPFPSAPPGSSAPDVVGLAIDDAIVRVTGAGFVAFVDPPKGSVESLAVSRQQPAAGAPVEGFREIALSLD
jgi:beta-lactam-binding protein with PASTA domain